MKTCPQALAQACLPILCHLVVVAVFHYNHHLPLGFDKEEDIPGPTPESRFPV